MFEEIRARERRHMQKGLLVGCVEPQIKQFSQVPGYSFFLSTPWGSVCGFSLHQKQEDERGKGPE